MPTAPLLATGRIGAAQLERRERRLEKLADSELSRVLLLHHPPTEGVDARRALTDAAALREVLRRTGAELVLHGHTHRCRSGELPGPCGAIPVVGARSASEVGSRPGKRARYHVYTFEPGSRRITLRVRAYDPITHRFHDAGGRLLAE
jgi:3',5'-cyclic AMP phosphodiesterase CpdA